MMGDKNVLFVAWANGRDRGMKIYEICTLCSNKDFNIESYKRLSARNKYVTFFSLVPGFSILQMKTTARTEKKTSTTTKTVW